MFGCFLVSQQRLHFASNYLVLSAGMFQELRAAALVQLQGTVIQIFDSTPEFRFHV
jgi:hypothetical protein